MKFPCIMCGNCCRMLHKVSFLSEYNSGGGVCKYLVNNKCDIYAERPLICNIEKMYEDHFKETIGQNEFFMTNILACKELAVWFDDKENLTKIDILIKRFRKILKNSSSNCDTI